MWRSEVVASGSRTQHVRLLQGDAVLSYEQVLDLWQGDATFREFFAMQLRESPHEAFRWETPPATAATRTRSFEFVLIDEPGLVVPPDAAAFAEHFDRAEPQGVAVFANLSGDSTLIVPTPQGQHQHYAHLAAFMRHAPGAQIHALWRNIGATMARQLGREPLWLSTAGMGVAWLHVRIDRRPKYYHHRPYRDPRA